MLAAFVTLEPSEFVGWGVVADEIGTKPTITYSNFISVSFSSGLWLWLDAILIFTISQPKVKLKVTLRD